MKRELINTANKQKNMKTQKQHWLVSLTQSTTLAALLLIPLAVHCEAPPLHASPTIQFSAVGLGNISALTLPKFSILSCTALNLKRAVVKAPRFGFSPLLAQSDPSAIVNKAVNFLKDIFLVIGCIVIAYGGYEISRGRVVEGLMCIFGGLVLAIAIPLMKWLLQIAAGG